MNPAASHTRQLSTAGERRETLVAAALGVFAERGYHAAPTMEIAKAAGISQAYVFRLFPTKAELFVAVCGLARSRMLATFRQAAAQARADGVEPLEAMGKAYADLVERDRDALLVQLHSQVAAAADPLIRESMRQTFREIHALVVRESGAGPQELKAWFAHGMLCNVMAAIDAKSLDADWAQTLTASPEGC